MTGRGAAAIHRQSLTSTLPGAAREHAVRHLAGFTGILQVDGYAAYEALTNRPRSGGPVTLAFCWSHFRRQFYDIAKAGDAPIATEALKRIGTLYEIEADIRGRSADERRTERQAAHNRSSKR